MLCQGVFFRSCCTDLYPPGLLPRLDFKREFFVQEVIESFESVSVQCKYRSDEVCGVLWAEDVCSRLNEVPGDQL